MGQKNLCPIPPQNLCTVDFSKTQNIKPGKGKLKMFIVGYEKIAEDTTTLRFETEQEINDYVETKDAVAIGTEITKHYIETTVYVKPFSKWAISSGLTKECLAVIKTYRHITNL